MSILAAQMQIRRRWLSMMMQRERGAERGMICRSSSFSSAGGADTHFLGNEEITHSQLLKRPPGTSTPGEYMHQRSRFPRDFFVSKESMPLYPLLFMVSCGITLGLVTMYREFAEHPTLVVSKKRRHNMVIPELDENEEVIVEQTRKYVESSPLRKIGLGGVLPRWMNQLNSQLFHQPERLPGDGKHGLD